MAFKEYFLWEHPYVYCVGPTYLLQGLFGYECQPHLSSACWPFPLRVGVTDVKVCRACPGCGAGPPLCSVVITALGQGLSSSCWSGGPEGQV